MAIIESWVDEKEISLYASQLLGSHASLQDSDDDFIIADPEEIFVAQQLSKLGNVEFGRSQADVDTMVASLAQDSSCGNNKAQSNAVKALQTASRKATSSGAITNNSSKGRQSENAGWSSHKGVSEELQEHLGDSAGALVNHSAVSGALEHITQICSAQWGVTELCISDRDGDIFWDTIQQPSWTKLTVSITEPIRLLDIRQGAIGHGYMHLKLTAETYLQVVVCSTSHGLLIFGMARAKALSATEVKSFVAEVRSLL